MAKGGDLLQCLKRDRRFGGLVHVVELAPSMAPAGGKEDVPLAGELLEPGIAIDMEYALEVLRCEAGRSALRSGANT